MNKKQLSRECYQITKRILDSSSANALEFSHTPFGYKGTDNMTDDELLFSHALLTASEELHKQQPAQLTATERIFVMHTLRAIAAYEEANGSDQLAMTFYKLLIDFSRLTPEELHTNTAIDIGERIADTYFEHAVQNK